MSRIPIAGALPVLAIVALLSGCATYHALPLAKGPDLAPSLSSLRVPGKGAGADGSAAFNAGDGLSLTEAVELAVFNNPNLRAERAGRGLARAQLLQAGLLPDPQISTSLDHPTDNGPGLVDAYGIGINMDLQALLTHGAAKSAAQAGEKQVDLQVLWREWQVAEQTRQVYLRCRMLDRLEKLYRTHLNDLQSLYDADRDALARGDITVTQSDADLAVLTDLRGKLGDLEKQRNQSRHDLNALLGLRPDAAVPLRGDASVAAISEQQMKQALATLPKRRPDLLALRAGYRSQEQKVREEILKQFPNITFGVNRARDTSDVHTLGFSLGFSLPLFNRNRGNIAVARATREQLHQQYQARLDDAQSKADRLFQESRLIEKQVRQTARGLPALQKAADGARQAVRDGDLSIATYSQLRDRAFTEQVNLIRYRGDLRQARLSLSTLLALPFAAPPKGAR